MMNNLENGLPTFRCYSNFAQGLGLPWAKSVLLANTTFWIVWPWALELDSIFGVQFGAFTSAADPSLVRLNRVDCTP